ncbi:MAG TPA: BamA/TamA family outer membrane protein [Gemmatimonadaceae bacterium]|nr:BamA/TamA family outer membrane protein [Gemmatimonadaceae bacterium]
MRRFVLALVSGLVLALFGVARTARAQDVECDPGDREVHSLDFVGNHAFSDDELALRIVTTASTWSRRNLRVLGTRRCLDSDELLRDKYRLQLLYRQAGYFNTKVDTLITPLTPTEVNVSFIIDEGQPVRITRLTIAGLDSVRDRDRILAGLWIAVGKPYDITLVERDVQTVLARLRNAGYPRPDVLRNYETSTKDSLTAHVALTFLPGPRAHIAAVQVDVTPNGGRTQEISDRIVRKLVGTGAGDLYREQALVDAQRNLYQTGAYRYVEVAPVIDSTTFAKDSAVTLRVTLIEDYMRDLNTEFGWATLDCFRARAQIVDKNFLGGAQRLELTGQLSKLGWAIADTKFTRQNLCYANYLREDPFSKSGNYAVNATVRQPALFGTWATPSFSLYSEQHGEYKAFLRTTYIGGEASLLKQLGTATTLRLGYNVELGKTEADQTLLCAAFSRCDTTAINQITHRLPLAIFSVAAARIATDNPINPTRGYVWRAESRNSATFLGSDPQLTFIKGVGDFAVYHPLSFGSVVAFRLRLGSVWGGATVNGIRQPPQQERLYAGGASSVRGYQQNELGALLYVFNDLDTIAVQHVSPDTVYFTYPHDTRRARRVVPVGGNTLFVTNLDYRVPSPFLPQLLQFTLFTDVGTVWNRNTLTNFGGFSPRITPGLGVRVFTPLGPIQVNAGYNPYPPKFGPALYTPTLQDQLGQGFTGVYCAVPDNAPAATAPVATLNPQGVWEADNSRECPATFQPRTPSGFFKRLTFTFSIGPDF